MRIDSLGPIIAFQGIGRFVHLTLLTAEADVAMKDEKLEVVPGSGNVFRDLVRFTVDWLMTVISRLGSRIEVKIRLRRVETAG